MDDDLQQLETELTQLSPAAPSPDLRRGIAAQLAGAESPRRTFIGPRLFWWLAVPAAAALAFLMGRHARHRSPEPGTPVVQSLPFSDQSQGAVSLPVLKPVAAENVLVSASDEGLVMLSDGTPARRERLHYVDTITWKNPRTNASLQWSVPREEIRVVPVSFQ
jgi:hypothetical protein